jgi:hypothetical protein
VTGVLDTTNGQTWPTADAASTPDPNAWQAALPAADEEEVDYDFDVAWRERKAAETPPKIRLNGVVYTLPNSLPALLILFGVNARKQGRAADSKVTVDEAFDLLSALLGRDNLLAILRGGLLLDDLPDLLERCQNIYKMRQEREATRGNQPAPATTGAAENVSGT